MSRYREGARSTFSQNGREYRLDDLFASARGKPKRYKVGTLDWIFRYATPDPKRTAKADPKVPILVTRSEGKTVVVDGLHRLAKAKKAGAKTIPARYVTKKQLGKAEIKPKGKK